ncbi:hypothetical protein PC116_g26913 [Phytophthora cactorum]|uniref:Uncharacterized protein n=1 Tax=Phytophthora cactorum TaxID=29920 RepID=A0A8T1JIX3_9STRA|nr:hypothetical protein PC112_g21963 [Phytophthora cactorum]KAG2875501.1 hypothetical protein PC114_g24678 [Phytophthora cactorum]KAG2883060.1 hypothetical protein PC115_g21742 [Phytophthora cactorum]KAG2968464.1 hypothetical protein PC119_g24204 [Phytophthora cactorum]KAG3053087.1 hypothetical protein PC122_g22441 [Phytophthora cactorum]
MLVEDGIVSCLKCEKIIHTSGKTHVERARYHFDKKCSKRLKTPLITSVFRPAMTPAKVPPPHVETRATDPYKLSNSRACGPETPVGLILYPGCRGVASHYFFLLNNINLYIPLFGKWERENIEEHGAGRTHGSGGAPDPLRARTLGRRHHDTLPHHVEETRRVGHRDLRLCKRARHAWQRVHGLRAVRGRRHSAQISTGWNPGYCVRHLEYWRGKELEGEGKAAVIAGETCEENGVKFLATD